jgi:hypothetical protein
MKSMAITQHKKTDAINEKALILTSCGNIQRGSSVTMSHGLNRTANAACAPAVGAGSRPQPAKKNRTLSSAVCARESLSPAIQDRQIALMTLSDFLFKELFVFGRTMQRGGR